MAAAQPCSIVLSSSTHVNIISAAGDVDPPLRRFWSLSLTRKLDFQLLSTLGTRKFLSPQIFTFFSKTHCASYVRIWCHRGMAGCTLLQRSALTSLLSRLCAILLIVIMQNGGTNCPACRSTSTSVSSSRVLQIMVDVLLRADPSRARTDREKQQADEIYRPGVTFRVRI